MSRYDYRIRRKVFHNRNTDKYKDFDALERRFRLHKRSSNTTKILIVLLLLVLLIGILVFSVNAESGHPVEKIIDNPEQLKFSNLPKRL